MVEEVSEDMVIISLVVVLVIGIAIDAVILGTSNRSQIESMGQMICDDKDLGDFVEFDKDSKTVKCEPKDQLIEYDSGDVKIQEGG